MERGFQGELICELVMLNVGVDTHNISEYLIAYVYIYIHIHMYIHMIGHGILYRGL